MARECAVCGKRPQKGHKVSHSNIKTIKRWMPNLQSVRLQLNGVIRRVTACVGCIKTATKRAG